MLGKEVSKMTILKIFKEHNEQVAELVGTDFAPGTLERYETSLKHTREFIKWKYKEDDFDIKKLDFEFISQFEYAQKIDDWSALLLAEVEEHFERIKAEVDQSVDTIDKAAAVIKSNQRPVHFSDRKQAFYYGLAQSLPWSVVAIICSILFSWLISTDEEYRERLRIVEAYENAPAYRLLMQNGEILQDERGSFLKLRAQGKKGDVLIGREYIFDKKTKEMLIPLGRK
ncbi:phage integrase SAM-like domain-containing protein [Dyadobacter sp. CY347]|uniref:phage integrase SAM-like domain-containing protein n=1 Tax=Dyadobacter sp. CY347 TaxID=2909336 RepID=UPI001F1626CF|nr:phage integrase SAM-like domain-containing protein [Dyadobacter sp. CY347]MCF2487512.1 phage integrase SAM-like domain-containing protein [Dyadobacter sp. CY347]